MEYYLIRRAAGFVPGTALEPIFGTIHRRMQSRRRAMSIRIRMETCSSYLGERLLPGAWVISCSTMKVRVSSSASAERAPHCAQYPVFRLQRVVASGHAVLLCSEPHTHRYVVPEVISDSPSSVPKGGTSPLYRSDNSDLPALFGLLLVSGGKAAMKGAS